MKKKGLILAVAMSAILTVGLFTGCSDTADSSATKASAPSGASSAADKEDKDASSEEATTATPVVEKDQYQVGDTLMVGDLKIIVLNSGVFKDYSEYLPPKDGNQFIYMTLYCENTGSSDESITFYSFEAYADGYAIDSCYQRDDALSASLSAGRSATGTVCFEAPVDAKEIIIEYESGFWTSTKTRFVYEGEKDSGITVDSKTEASADVVEVGSTIETDKFRITYVSCEEYISDNQFLQPKEGYQYMSMTFDIENISSSDQTMNMFDFDAYADGKAVDGFYGRDDELSASLSAGMKAKGTISFEVPIDAKVIEAELDVSWLNSEHVIFKMK